ncbi:MAG: hypothetical protein AB1390_00325 [Nitrospirota bacterium]
MIKKSFLTALLVAIGIFAFSLAQADQIDGLANSAGPASPTTIYVNPGGLGDALIYGYYNARGSFNLIRVVNVSTNTGVSAKVRFREGEDSNEVLDFFICLSAGDQWSAFLIDDGNVNNPAQLVWFDDDTPTFPDPQGNNVVTDNFLASVSLSTAAATSVTADDTKEGYLEIIGVSAWADVPGSAKVVDTPNACGETIGIFGIDEPGFVAPSLFDVPNVLAGNDYIFNVAAGAGTYAYNATPLANFRSTIVANPGLGTDDPPRLSDATETLNAVNYVLTKATEHAIYDISSLLGGGAMIINTFPTKRLSIELDPLGTLNGPFNDAAIIETDGEIGDSVARCEQISLLVWDDAENTPGATVGFSPSEPVVRSKCDEVSVLLVGDTATALLNTELDQFNIPVTGFQLGHIDITLTGTGRTTTVGALTTSGLPVISYELQGFIDGFFTHMLPLRYTTQIGP